MLLQSQYFADRIAQSDASLDNQIDLAFQLAFSRHVTADELNASRTLVNKQGLMHRDIKPANILLENGVERVKITDFGLARAVDDLSVTRTGEVAGTPQYMAPEQIHGDRVDQRADLFSLGSVLYCMCIGRPPFRGETVISVIRRVCDETPRPIREVNPDIPVWLCEIIDKLLQKKPEDRYQTAREVSELLGEHLAHLQHPSQIQLPQTACPGRREWPLSRCPSAISSPWPTGNGACR